VQDFVTDALATPAADDAITFKHDGRDVTFYSPTTGQFAVMLMLSAKVVNQEDKSNVDPQLLSTFIEFFFELMEDDTAKYFRHRLLDRKDSFELDSVGGVSDIFKALFGEWSANRPTRKPSGSQPARRATGKGSSGTSRASASTSSPSRSRNSSR
jgi:hypothetical protein